MGRSGLRSASALALVVLFGLSAVVFAQNPGKQKPRQVPQTGVEKVATPADAAGEALLERMTSRSSEGLVERFHGDGTVSMDLQGRFMSVMVATTSDDGSQAVSCQIGQEALKQATTIRSAVQPAARRTARPAPTTSPVRELK
jgi:hypothetical protein